VRVRFRKGGAFRLGCGGPCELYFDTVCLIGSLGFLQARITPEAARRSVHLSACGLYHALCHAAVFEPEPLSPRAFAKAAFFLMRTQRYLETGKYRCVSPHCCRCSMPKSARCFVRSDEILFRRTLRGLTAPPLLGVRK
jgi:hypothetical protein